MRLVRAFLSTLRPIGQIRSSRLLLWLGWLLLSAGLIAAESDARRVEFNVPAGDAVQTLQIFSQQSGLQILYPVERLRGMTTRPVRGQLTVREALDELLEHSGLQALQDWQSGAIVIVGAANVASAAKPPAPAKAQRAAPAPHRQSRAAKTDARTSDELVVLSPFEVRSASDVGYRAANSVSATRIAAPIRDLPISINAFTEEFIADQHAYDLYDIVKWAPGVHQDNVSPQGWVRYNIRGFTSAAVQRNGFGSFRFIDTTNVARIEVIKGPSSLLYGQINPGGVINYITKRPEPVRRVEVSASLGDHGYNRAMIDATGPVPGSGDKLLYRAIAMQEDIQRFHSLSRGKKYLFAPSATLRLSDHSSLRLEYEHFERREDMLTSGVVLIYEDRIPTVPYPGLPWNFSYAGTGDYQDFVSDAFSAELTTRFGENITLRTIYLDSYWDMEWRATGQGGTGLVSQSVIDTYYPPSAGLTPADAMFRRNRWEHQWGGERTAQIDLHGKFPLKGATLTTLVGYKRNFETRTRSLQLNNPNIAGHPHYLKPWDLRNPATWDRSVPFGIEALLPAASSLSSSNASSLFGVASLSALQDRLHLLAGYAQHRVHNNPSYNFSAGTVVPSSDRSAGVPQAGVMLELVKGVSAFVSYSESFLANTSMLRVNNVPMIPAAPAVGKGWEIGTKLELLDGLLSGSVSAYHVRARPTGIVSVTTGIDESGTTLFSDIQGGSQRSNGLEVDLLFTPSPGLQVMLAFSHCDATYERHPTNPLLNGTSLVATPEQTFSAWGKYQVQQGPLRGLTIAGGLSYVGSMAYVANNPFVRLPNYTTVDLSIGYSFPALGTRWTADLAMKNVANEHYYASSSSWGFPRHTIFSLGTKF